MHYYQHSIGDYRRDTMHLTLLEHGVYRQLLDLYYLDECELDANALRKICARSAEEVQAAETVLNEFFVKTETGYKHKRCDAEIAKFHNKSAKAKASADARWSGNKGKNADAMRTHSEGNANHKPITNNHKPITNIKKLLADKSSDEVTFDEFYSAYPKKVKRQEAERSWKKLNGTNKKTIMDDIEKRKALCWHDKQYIPAPSTYLNGKRWEDEIVANKKSEEILKTNKEHEGWIR